MKIFWGCSALDFRDSIKGESPYKNIAFWGPSYLDLHFLYGNVYNMIFYIGFVTNQDKNKSRIF